MAPWTLAHQAPLSIEFSRLEYWSGLPFPTPQHLPDPGIEPVSLCTSCDGRQFCYHCATWEDATDVDSWTIKSTTELMLSNCGAGEDSREPLKKQGNQTSQSSRKSILNIHWKHLCWSWSSNILPDVKSQFIGKDPDAGKDWRQEKGVTEDEMVGWHNWLNGHEFEQTLGADGQGGLEYLQSMVSQSPTRLSNWPLPTTTELWLYDVVNLKRLFNLVELQVPLDLFLHL